VAEDDRGEVLVAILNNLEDLEIARCRHWYRIPVASAQRWLKRRWPPTWLAFYQTKVFGDEAYAVRYYARVLNICVVRRNELFPDQAPNAKTKRRYYQLTIGSLKQLPAPILSHRWRRIVFIPTTWRKFVEAVEINDLYDGSPLEDRLWAAFKRYEIKAERQFFIENQGRSYALDFAMFCNDDNIDIETDGDTWHADKARIPLDNRRDNDMNDLGWHVLRFNGQQVREELAEYCIPTVMNAINRESGPSSDGLIPRTFNADDPDGPQQMTLF